MNIHAGFSLQHDGRWLTHKDPDDVLVYGRDLSKRFPGRTIATCVVAAAEGVTAGEPIVTGSLARVQVSGGTAGSAGYVTLRCTLDDGQVTDLTMWVQIVAK
jgi:hypothetical protein